MIIGKRNLYVLYLPGGALWGLHAAICLDFIEKATETPVSKLFNVFSGASAGSIVTSALNVEDPESAGEPLLSAEQTVDFFNFWGPKIFPYKPDYYREMVRHETIERMKEALGASDGGLMRKGLIKAIDVISGNNEFQKYDPEVLRRSLQSGYIDFLRKTGRQPDLSDMLRSHLISAYNLEDDIPVLLQNRKNSYYTIGERNRQVVSHDYPVIDAVMGSCAASTVFPSHRAPDGKNYVDIGMVDTPRQTVAEVLKHKRRNANVKLTVLDTGCLRFKVDAEKYNRRSILGLIDGNKGRILFHVYNNTARQNGLMGVISRLGAENVTYITKALNPHTSLSDNVRAMFPKKDFMDSSEENMRAINSFGKAMVVENLEILTKTLQEAFENAVREGHVRGEKITRVRNRLEELHAFSQTHANNLHGVMNRSGYREDDAPVPGFLTEWLGAHPESVKMIIPKQEMLQQCQCSQMRFRCGQEQRASHE